MFTLCNSLNCELKKKEHNCQSEGSTMLIYFITWSTLLNQFYIKYACKVLRERKKENLLIEKEKENSN